MGLRRDQGAHRFLDTGGRRYGRGNRVGEEGSHLMRCGGRGARASLPGSECCNGIVSQIFYVQIFYVQDFNEGPVTR